MSEATKTIAEYQAAVNEIVAICKKHQIVLIPASSNITERHWIMLMHCDNRWAQTSGGDTPNVVRFDVDVAMVDLIRP